jgi:homospermidine synthase
LFHIHRNHPLIPDKSIAKGFQKISTIFLPFIEKKTAVAVSREKIMINEGSLLPNDSHFKEKNNEIDRKRLSFFSYKKMLSPFFPSSERKSILRSLSVKTCPMAY